MVASQPAPFAELVRAVLDRSELLSRSPRTHTAYAKVAERFAAWVRVAQPRVLDDVRLLQRTDIEQFLLARRRAGCAWNTLRTEWAYLRGILQQAVRDERLLRVPNPEIRWEAKIAEDRRAGRTREHGHRVLDLVPTFLRVAEEAEIYRVIPLTSTALLHFLAFTGARAGEVLYAGNLGEGMRWRDIEGLETNTPVAVIRGGKGRAFGPRRIPIPGPAANALRSLLPGEPEDLIWPWSKVQRTWDLVRGRAEKSLPAELQAAARALRIHDLRHFASHYWRSLGVPDRLIDRLLGHRTPVIAQRYAAADEREVGEACARALGASAPESEPEPRRDPPGAELDVPDIITLDFDYWHRRNGSKASGGGD